MYVGPFSQCELSRSKLLVKVSMLCNNINKVFVTELKVLKDLPYEIILGRSDMRDHNLTFNCVQTDTLQTPNHATQREGNTQPDLDTRHDLAQSEEGMGIPLDSQSPIAT